MDIKCFGDGGQSHKCHLSASSLSLSLIVGSLVCVSALCRRRIASLSPRGAHISIWHWAGWMTRVLHTGVRTWKIVLYIRHSWRVCVYGKGETICWAQMKIHSLATNTQEGYSREREKKRWRRFSSARVSERERNAARQKFQLLLVL